MTHYFATLAGYCTAHGIDMAAAGDAELARVWTCVDKIRAKQAAKAGIVPPADTALTAPAPGAAELRCVEQELRDCETVCGRLAVLLDKTATALKGDPGPLKGHSFHDLPELCAALSARVAELEAAVTCALWHHLGGHSDLGALLRKTLGMVMADRLTEAQVATARALLSKPAPGAEGGA